MYNDSKFIPDVGGKFGGKSNCTPFKGYNFYVDFRGLLINLIRYCLTNPVLAENSKIFESEMEDELYENGTANKNDFLVNKNYYNIALENWERIGLDFGFYVTSINLPKFTMKNVKINFMDNVYNNAIKTSYGGELNVSIKSTLHNITKLSILLGFFEVLDVLWGNGDTFDMWGNVYTFRGLTTHDRQNGRGLDAVSARTEIGSPNIDVVLVDDMLNDGMVYRLINPIITSVDFGNFMYGTNGINEIRMTISYNSWYVIDGKTRLPADNQGDGNKLMQEYNKFTKFLDGIFEKLGDYREDLMEDANDIGSGLPWG